MSRHPLPAKQDSLTVTVGWDTGLSTYFAIVTEEVGDDERDNVRLWIGGKPRECLRAEELVEPLRSFAVLDEATLAKLRKDREVAPSPSPLQRLMVEALSGGRRR